MPDLATLRGFGVQEASTTLWVFKKRVGEKGQPIFTGRWAELDEALSDAVKEAIRASIDSIEELLDYGLTAQNNEASALSISLIETHADKLVMKAAQESPSLRVTRAEHLENSAFYAVKMTNGDETLYAVHKTDAAYWRTHKKKGFISFLFDQHELVINDKPSFNISRHFDFFIVKDEIMIKSKGHFESVLSCKTAFEGDFVALREEPEFKSAFVNLDELIEFVGSNKIQLRRVAAIRQKGYYKSAGFMNNLRENYKNAGLNIVFGNDGKIVPTQDTCKDIFLALLDFRLTSMFSNNLYDVPDTSAVSHS